MAAEDSEKLARRLQAEEDAIADILLYDKHDDTLARRLHEDAIPQPRTDNSTADLEVLDSNDNNHDTNSNTVNNTIDSDEALARLLQAEEELQVLGSEKPKPIIEKDPIALPVTTPLESDEDLARRLQAEENQTSSASQQAEKVDDDLELFSPTPDIHALFRHFDVQYFFGMLKMVEVSSSFWI